MFALILIICMASSGIDFPDWAYVLAALAILES